MQQITLKNHEREPNSWYVSDRPGVFNPYNSSDRISRKTWYENITYPDLTRNKLRVKKAPKVEQNIPHVHTGSNVLFTSLSCPECSKG